MRLRSTSPPLSPNSPGNFQQQPGFYRLPQHGDNERETIHISPTTALELRIRYLEALVKGVEGDNQTTTEESTKEKRVKFQSHAIEEHSTSIITQLEEIQTRLDGLVATNDGLKRFMQYYKLYSNYLSPAFSLDNPSDPAPDTMMSMSPSEFEAYLRDMEPDIRNAERDLREIDALEKRGVTAAGNLGVHEELQPRLEALQAAHAEDMKMAADLEQRIAQLLQRYTFRVDTLSELFIEWDDVISRAEHRVKVLLKEKEEKRKMGYD